jgi:hypothetical protein
MNCSLCLSGKINKVQRHVETQLLVGRESEDWLHKHSVG